MSWDLSRDMPNCFQSSKKPVFNPYCTCIWINFHWFFICFDINLYFISLSRINPGSIFVDMIPSKCNFCLTSTKFCCLSHCVQIKFLYSVSSFLCSVIVLNKTWFQKSFQNAMSLHWIRNPNSNSRFEFEFTSVVGFIMSTMHDLYYQIWIKWLRETYVHTFN